MLLASLQMRALKKPMDVVRYLEELSKVNRNLSIFRSSSSLKQIRCPLFCKRSLRMPGSRESEKKGRMLKRVERPVLAEMVEKTKARQKEGRKTEV